LTAELNVTAAMRMSSMLLLTGCWMIEFIKLIELIGLIGFIG